MHAVHTQAALFRSVSLQATLQYMNAVHTQEALFC